MPLPAEVERIRADGADDREKALAIHTDVFDGFLRYLAAILAEDERADRRRSSGPRSRAASHEHAADHPELADAAAAYDLFRPRVPRTAA